MNGTCFVPIATCPLPQPQPWVLSCVLPIVGGGQVRRLRALGRCWLGWGVAKTETHVLSDNLTPHDRFVVAAESSVSRPPAQREETSLSAGANVALVITPLLPLIAAIGCKETQEYLRENLAKTSRLYRELEAVADLWRSLGCPRDGFWPALLVDYNRIAAEPPLNWIQCSW